MKKTTSALILFLSLITLLSSCAGNVPEESSAAVSQPTPAIVFGNAGEIKADLSKAKLYCSTDPADGKSFVKNGFYMLDKFTDGKIVSTFAISDDIPTEADGWGVFDIDSSKFKALENPDYLTSRYPATGTVIMNKSDLYTITEYKEEAGKVGKCAMAKISISDGKTTALFDIDASSPTKFKLFKLNDSEFLWGYNSVMKYNVKTQESTEFIAPEENTEILSFCAYDERVYIACDVSGSNKIRVYSSDGKLTDEYDAASAGKYVSIFYVIDKYIFIGFNSPSMFTVRNGKLEPYGNKNDECRPLTGYENVTDGETCPYLVYKKTPADSKDSEYRLIDLKNGHDFKLTFECEDKDYNNISAVTTDGNGSFLLSVYKEENNYRYDRYYYIKSNLIADALK